MIVSFGGAAGTELALACSTVDALQAQYQSVIDTYGFTRLDFDIEGSALSNTDANTRRAKAIAGLQAAASAANKKLTVQFTLPVMPSGLTQGGRDLLQNAIDNGVDIGVVNVMAMDYGRSYDPDNMGQYAVDAMTNTRDQLKVLYSEAEPPKTEAQVNAMVGVTPMIGLNDVSPEVFTTDDAEYLLNVAQVVRHRLPRLLVRHPRSAVPEKTGGVAHVQRRPSGDMGFHENLHTLHGGAGALLPVIPSGARGT